MRRLVPALLLAGAATLVHGCSQVPDALNPAEWYKSTAELFSGEDEDAGQADEPAPVPGTPAAERDQPPPGADEPFPNLASVPERPEVDSTQVRQQIAEGLVADRQQARYSSEVIRRQGEAVNPLMTSAAATPQSPPPPPPSIPESSGPASVPTPMATPAPAEPAASPLPAPPAAAPPPPPPSVPTAAAQQPAPSPPPPPQVAALPSPPAPQQAQPAPQPSSVGEVFRSRIAEQNRLPSQMAGDGAAARPDRTGPAGDPGTVVVSSGGVVDGQAWEGGYGSPLSAMPQGSTGPAPYSSLPSQGTVKVATIIFANGSSRLSGKDRQILNDVVAIHRERGGIVHVIGHASSRTRSMDPQRHQQVNYQMSAARADAVANALASMGVPREAIRVDARSDADPMYYEVMPTGEAGNRRAEIYLES